MTEPMVSANTDPPAVRCRTCGGRMRWAGPRWARCRNGCYSSHDPRRVGLWWRLRVLVGR